MGKWRNLAEQNTHVNDTDASTHTLHIALGLISTSTSEVVSLVSPIDSKQVRKAVRYSTASVRTRTEWYDIVSFQFLGHFSVSPSFWTCFGMDRLIVFHTHVNATPLCTTQFGTDQSGTVRYRTRVNRAKNMGIGLF